LGAAGTVAVSSVAAVYSGSYLGWDVMGLVTGFWCGVALVGSVVIGGLVSPLVALVKGRSRLAILPGLIVAAVFLANALLTRRAIIDNDPIGKTLFLNVYFMGAWAVLLGAITGVLIIQSKRAGDWAVTFVMLLSVLVSCGLAYFVWQEAEAFAFVAGPLALSGVVMALLEKLRRAVLRAAAMAGVAVVYAAALFITADITGEKALAPIERSIAPAPGKLAKLTGKPNVVIIVIDTMRQNHTSLGGYRYRTTANLEALSADCQFYPNGVATNSSTLASHASLFTGMYPREHGAHEGAAQWVTVMDHSLGDAIKLDSSRGTLATYLSREGYDTAGIAANYARLCRQLGVDQGFSYYYDLPRMLIFTRGGAPLFDYGLDAVDKMLGKNGKLVQTFLDGRAVTRLATDWIERKGRRPFFVFLNYMDAHYPYSAPPPFDSIDGPGIGYNPVLRMDPWRKLSVKYMEDGTGLTPEFLREIVNQYDGGLAYADHWVGKFIETLKTLGLYDNTLIVVTSDHGEWFGEHGLLTHDMELYEDGVRVPILVKYPGQEHKGEVRQERVSILDIFGTVFDVLEMPLPAVTAQPLDRVTHAIMAENFSPGIGRGKHNSRMKRTLTVVYSGDYKYTHSTTGQNELYDLAADPGELKNVVKEKAEIAARLEAEAADYLARTAEEEPAPAESDDDDA